MIKHKPLTWDDYVNYYGQPPEYTVRGVSFFDEDEIVGIVTISRIHWHQWLMVGLKRTDYAMKRALIKAWPAVKRMLSSPVYVVEDDFPTAKGFIRHFGFKPFYDDVWVM